VEHGMKTAEKETQTQTQPQRKGNGKGDFGSLSTPAVRHLTKELDVNISDVTGTGRDGRVTKEDVHRFVSQKTQQTTEAEQPSSTSASTPTTHAAQQQDQKLPLTPVQTQMFKIMTKSLNIPHFLYTSSADMSAVTATRKRLNAAKTTEKLTHLPFIIKATSLALQKHPLLNSTLDTTSDPKKPSLTYRSAHNFGVAVDTPSGLLVPVLRNVQDLSIAQIAQQLRVLSEKARTGKLAPGDFSGASFTISNIGSVGGGVVAPIISEPQVAILGVGRSKVVPAFDENDELIKREELVLSWSADHRVVDGAECARCAEHVTRLLEEPMGMLIEMR
jgi:2-oxoisovalerate dehydrogenase E2 component (dihydrolipoyl transacylase)